MKKGDALRHKIRRQIYDSLLENPGLHSREISRRLHIPISTLKYHLGFLEKQKLIKMERDGRCLHCYCTDTIDVREKKVISVLRKYASRQIILFLLLHEYSSKMDISRKLEKHPTTIEFHLKKLLELDIIKPMTVSDGEIFNEINSEAMEYFSVGNEVIYMLKEPRFIYDLYTTYKDSFLDDGSAFIL